MKNSFLQLRKRWIVCNHGNQLPPEPVLNLFSYDNSPQPTALVRQPVHSGCLLLKVSQQGTGSVQTSEGDQSVTVSPRDCPADGITPLLNLKLICLELQMSPKPFVSATVCSAWRDDVGPALTYFRH